MKETTPIERYALVVLRSALRLESVGIKFSRFSAAHAARTHTKTKTRNKVQLLAEYEAWLRDKKLIQ